jgi:hypothetical protein
VDDQARALRCLHDGLAASASVIWLTFTAAVACDVSVIGSRQGPCVVLRETWRMPCACKPKWWR